MSKKATKSLNEAKFLQGILETFHTIKNSSEKDGQTNPTSFSDEDYRDFLEKIFSEIRFSNPRNFRILNYSLSQIKFDFANFIKFICIFLQFTDGLLTKLKMIGKQIHIFIFTDDENYLKEAEEYGHNFELSEEAKIYLLNDYKNNYNIHNNPNKNNILSHEEIENRKKDKSKSKSLDKFDDLNDLINRNIYVPYKSILIKFYKFYDINTDMPIENKGVNDKDNDNANKKENLNTKEDENNNNNVAKKIDINILKKNDKIKILKNMISRTISSQFLAEINSLNKQNSEKNKVLIEETIISNDNYNQNVQKEKMY